MDEKRVAARLPKKPEEKTLQAMVNLCRDGRELGNEYILYSRDSVPAERENDGEGGRRAWGAVCSCTACGEDFIAGWLDGGEGIALSCGEDGELYDGWCQPGEPGTDLVMEGKAMLCPICDTEAVLVRRKQMGRGKTWRCLVQVPQTVADGDARYTAILGWMIERTVYGTGHGHTAALPAEATVLDERGRLHRYAWAEGEDGAHRWVHRTRVRTMQQYLYYTVCGDRKHGGLLLDTGTDFAGESGEKTGLAAYLRAGGENPVTYLRLWRRHRYVENLLHTGLAGAVADELRRTGTAELPWADLRQPRPADMVGMTREELRTVCTGWDATTANYWARVRGTMTATEYTATAEQLRGCGGVRVLAEIVESAGDPQRVIRYLKKQEQLTGTGIRLLLDLWRAIERQNRPLTEEVRWPRDLQQAHDRETAAAALYKSREKSRALQAGFDAIREKYGALEWTDGDLCIRLPRGNEELIAEGETLRHCVGGYGQAHTSGRDVIFFVRHARRPERSYYTLDICMNGGEPHEVQLHGYGNERHGERKQHRHRIPQAVRDFCDRWEQEVLQPWYRAQKRKKNRKATRQEEAA